MSGIEIGFGEVADLLGRRMGELCSALGLPDKPRQGDLLTPLNPTRADNHPGSFVIQLGGFKAGRWNEYATGEGGDALDLVAYVQFGGTTDRAAKREAFRWAKRWLGLSDEPERLSHGTAKLEAARATALERKQQADAHLAASLEKKRRSAFRMWKEAQTLAPPALGARPSPAWRYFTECRGLPLETLPRLPSAVRWSAAQRHVESDRIVPAIVSAMFMPDGRLVSVHRIFLEPDGLSKIRAGSAPAKKIWPAGYLGAFIPISRGASDLPVKEAAARGVQDTVFYCEGVEDGFTAALLVPEWRVNAIGAGRNFAAQEPPACTKAVVVGRDNDPDAKVRRAVGERIAELRGRCSERGLALYETRAKQAKDFNDMVKGAPA